MDVKLMMVMMMMMMMMMMMFSPTPNWYGLDEETLRTRNFFSGS